MSSRTTADVAPAARIPIGSFARLTGLSVGALRHYDELDLLRPIDVDRFTGYRRYAQDQVAIARTMPRGSRRVSTASATSSMSSDS